MDTGTATVRATGPDGIVMEVTGQIGNRDVALNFLSVMREIYQNRQAPPLPQGEVRAGNPSDAANLRAYSDDERQAVVRQWEKAIPPHDREVLEWIDGARKAITGEAASTEHGQSAPLEQPEKSKE